MSENQETVSITISINEKSVSYESPLPLPEIVFWLESVKTMILKQLLDEK